jgi:hypothetical protein
MLNKIKCWFGYHDYIQYVTGTISRKMSGSIAINKNFVDYYCRCCKKEKRELSDPPPSEFEKLNMERSNKIKNILNVK